MIRIWKKYLGKYWLTVGILILLMFAQVTLSLYLPNFQAEIIDEGIVKGDKHAIYLIGVEMMIFSLLLLVALLLATYIAARLSMRMGYELRRDIFGHIQTFSLKEVEKFSAGSLITRSTNDVQQLQQATLQTIIMVLPAPIMIVGGIFMALQQNAQLTWSLAVIMPVVILVAALLMSRMEPLFKSMQDRLDEINRLIREKITGVRVIRAFSREETEVHRFQEANDRMYKVLISVGRLMSMMIPIMFFIINLSNIAIMWFGGKLIEEGNMQIGSLQAFIQYLMIIFIGLMMAAMMVVMLPRAVVCAKRINEVMDTECSIVEPKTPYTPQNPTGTIEFRDVSFKYAGAEDNVLSNISFTAKPGTTTAIIGSTGSGKSSIIRLASRMYDVNSGQVLIDGHDVREYDLQTLAQFFGVVPQKALLFTGTIRSNMLYGDPNATDEQIWEALEVAQAKDFVEALPEGLDSLVAQGGTNFSGGQKQRLCIARAVLRKPLIYTFDDSFSALDMQTDRKLQAALAPWTKEATQIVVAQRAASIVNADQILVLDKGEIVGVGTHSELMETCKTYQEIVNSQGGSSDIESMMGEVSK